MRKPGFTAFRRLSVFLLALCLFCAGSAAGEGTFSLIGDWAFTHAPETSVLTLREDGTAVYAGRSWTWAPDGADPRRAVLNSEAGSVTIRFAEGKKDLLIYLPGEYTRRDKLEDEEIWGAWISDASDLSSFIFEKDGRFMEDNTFVGRYTVDSEEGTFLLQYQPTGTFEDTLCYFDREGDHMTVYYPWPVTAVQTAP